jgi:hypothetical protein
LLSWKKLKKKLSSKEIDKEALKQASSIVKKFEGKLKNRFIEEYQINLLIEKFRAYDLILSFGLKQVHEMVDHYFRVQENPSWPHFLKNSTRVRRAMLDQIKDMETRKLLAGQAKEWLNK